MVLCQYFFGNWKNISGQYVQRLATELVPNIRSSELNITVHIIRTYYTNPTLTQQLN